MHRNWLLEKLRAYQPETEADAACQQRFLSFVSSQPLCFERSLQEGHITGSAWLLDRTGKSVLLTHHRKLGKWLQLGGHADGDPDVLGVAIREVFEESGIGEIEPWFDGIFDLDDHWIPANSRDPAHIHYDVRFALRVTGSMDFKVSEESIDLAWVPVAEVARYNPEESMVRMVRKSPS